MVGVPRSGTTLLRLILNAHSCISLGPETHFFKQVWERRNYYGDLSNHANLLKLWGEYSLTKSFDDFGFVDKARVEKTVLKSVRNYADFLRILLELYAKNNHKRVWGEKTPEHLFNVTEIVKWYPDAKVVHVIRDPRAVCASLTKVPWSSDDVISNARVWNCYLSFAEELHSGKNRESVLEVCYEDLIRSTEATLKRVCGFIEIKFEPGMLSFYKDSRKFIEKNEPWKDNVLTPLNICSIDKWKKELSVVQQKEIETKTRRFMLKYGYLRSESVFGVLSYLPSSLYVHMKWAVRRFLFHVRNKL